MFSTYGFYDQEIMPISEINVSPLDLSIHRGYSIFDFFRFRITKDNPYLDWYFDRFYNSAKKVQLKSPYNKIELESICRNLLSHNQLDDAFVKLILSAGVSQNGFKKSLLSNLMVLVSPYKKQDASLYQYGAKLITAKYIRDIPDVKSTNYLYVASIQDRLESEHAVDVLFHDGTFASECSRSNIFIVKNEIIYTTNKHILEGITRRKLLELAKTSNPIQFSQIKLSELYLADEVFITSTTKSIMPIVQINDMKIGNGHVGSITQDLMTQPIFAT